MKEKTSITLSREVLTGIDSIAGSKQSRSAFIEAILSQYLRERKKTQRDARDLELIKRHADELNRDALEALEHQAPLGEFPED
jgi:metal-responsive CopG/Arc/MetJ family transcriptional regulator